ncbi:asparagine synthase (glutamine-hydrolyzing) [Helicobacter aurati]|uniref:asparagine synthase (glutamine-hydrolyzing) n=1 Tax=Helicobacter aurati TaxID=137778 RepID=UPI001F4864FE|nr:asparagine synthase (glutamine-hydrolyzing) [Helicobacter aurati]
MYNFLELQQELIAKGYIFHTHSDSEVILASFDAWGEKCLHRFNGMWALAIFNHKNQELFLSRDRFGKKPLFYAFIKNNTGKEQFIFASEMKAIYPFLSEVRPANNFKNLTHIGNIFNYEHTQNTLIQGIQRFPHAHYAFVNADCLSKQQLQTTRYYHILEHLPYNPHNPKPYTEIVQEFRNLFLDSVAIRMRSDVRIGTALSGGVDSSATICAMSYLSKKQLPSIRNLHKDWQHACVACFKDTPLDESKYARMVCDYINIKGEFIEINPLNHWEKIEEYFYLFEDIYITSPIPMIATYRAIKEKGVTVTLDGHGADELFSGYGHIIQALWDAKYRPKSIKNILHTLNDTRENPKSPFGMYKEGMQFLCKSLSRKIRHKFPMPMDSHSNFGLLDYFSKWLYEIFDKTILPTLLRNYDRYSMINGVEIRMPFLDHRLVELVFSLPYSYKIRNGYTKSLIRDSLHDFMPESVIWRKNKIGFNSPIIQWMQRNKANNGLQEWFLDIAHSRDFLECPLIRDSKKLQDLILRICNKQESSFNAGEIVWCGISPYLWQKSLKFALHNG